MSEEEKKAETEKPKTDGDNSLAGQLLKDANTVYKSLKTLEMMRGDSLNTFKLQQLTNTQGNIQSAALFPINEKGEHLTEEQKKLHDLMSMIELKNNKKLTEEEKDYIKGLEAQRAVYNVDEYIKLQDVRKIMVEGLSTVYEKLKRQDDIARDNRLKLTNMNSKVEACIRTVGQISKLQSSTDVLFKHFKDHEVRLNEHVADKKQLKEEFDVTIDKVKVLVQSLNARLTKCESDQDLAALAQQRANSRIDSVENTYMENLMALRQKIEDDTNELKQRVESIPGLVHQNFTEIQNIKLDIEEKTTEKITSVLNALKSDEFRIQDLEAKIRVLDKIKIQNTTLSVSVQKLEQEKEEWFSLKHFIERSLPLLIHIQICEGLQVVSGDYMSRLKKFEQKKLDQLLNYIEKGRGKAVKVAKFGERLKFFAEKVKEQK